MILTYSGERSGQGQDKYACKTKFFYWMGLQAHNDSASRASPARKWCFTLRNVVLLGDSLAVELPALTRSALVRIQVPQPSFPKDAKFFMQSVFWVAFLFHHILSQMLTKFPDT